MHSRSLLYPVNVATLPGRGLRVLLEPGEAERADLARYVGVLSVNTFHGELVFRRWHKNGVAVSGEIRAHVTQECVVTLEPVVNSVSETVERWFVPDGSKLARPQLNQEGEWIIDPDGPDVPDPFTGDELDAWEIAMEHLLLGIEPYPRKQGAEFDQQGIGETEDSGSTHRQKPFAGLKDLLKDSD